jgi:hypothetical protein
VRLSLFIRSKKKRSAISRCYIDCSVHSAVTEPYRRFDRRSIRSWALTSSGSFFFILSTLFLTSVCRSFSTAFGLGSFVRFHLVFSLLIITVFNTPQLCRILWGLTSQTFAGDAVVGSFIFFWQLFINFFWGGETENEDNACYGGTEAKTHQLGRAAFPFSKMAPFVIGEIFIGQSSFFFFWFSFQMDEDICFPLPLDRIIL